MSMATTSPSPRTASHHWRFYRTGGVDQVRIDTGADILHLDELDEKLWVALACPVQGLELDERTLALLDQDGDAHLRPPEIKAAVRWLRSVLKTADELAKGHDGVALANLRTDTDEGKALLQAAKHLLKQIGKSDASSFTVADVTVEADKLAAAATNGDGIVVPETIADAALQSLATEVVTCTDGAMDRSGKPGIDPATIDAFYAACADYSAWCQDGEAKAAEVLPFGDGTAAAYAAFSAIRGKVDDFFARCRVAAFDARALAALNREETAYVEAAAKDLRITAEELAGFPLAMVAANKPLPLTNGINPAWIAHVAAFRGTCCPKLEAIDETGWAAIAAKFAAYEAHVAAKKGGAVEALGLTRVRTILADAGGKPALLAACEADAAVATEVAAIGQLEKLARLHRDFATLLRNYVSFADFYARKGAIFQAGTLYLDGRALDLCFHVANGGKHAGMAPMAKTYLAYVDCKRPGAAPMQVACAFTAGDSDNLFAGRNGVFYDRKGNDWNATIAKIVDNPISVGQAFWSPYKKLLRWIEEQVAKRAAAAESDSTTKLQAGAEKAGAAAGTGTAAPAKKMDIGVLAAISVAISGITAILGTVLESFFGLGYLMPLGLLGLILLISGPSMLIAWMKLRQRNLGPLLDANGWAVNALTRINLPLGRALTELPKLPAGSERSLIDPYAEKKSVWPRVLLVLAVLGAIGYGLYRVNLLHKWLPQYAWLQHHTELDLAAKADGGKPGETIEFVVKSTAGKLAVIDRSDANSPKAVADLEVAAGAAKWTIPADAKPGSKFVVRDAVSGTEVTITVPQ